MLSEEQKEQILCPLSSTKSSVLRISGFISEKIIDWHQTLMIKLIGKGVEWRTKTANIVPTVFDQKFGFENFGLHFWENNWLTSNINNRLIVKNGERKAKSSKSKSWLLRASTFISEKVNDWRQTKMIKNIGKDVDWRTKTENTEPTVFE
jgi:hypothetical protein